MICPKCQKLIPDGKLACLPCMTRAYEAEILDRQVEFVRGALRGSPSFSMAQSHLGRFGQRDRSLCGKAIWGPWKAVPYWQLSKLPHLCPDCRRVLDQLVARVDSGRTKEEV